MPVPMSRPVRVRVSGDWACFTRPEMKVERVTYQYMTPSAARGALEAICWHPQFRWVIMQIEVLKPVRYQSVTRNEVQRKIPVGNIAEWVRDPGTMKPFYANARGREDGENATQRNTLALRDVAYNITARALVNGDDLRPEDTPEKYAAMFERRVEKGQCFSRPYLGCREFAADFRAVDPTETLVSDTMELGLMLYDIVFSADVKNTANEAVFFHARIERGLMVTDPALALPDDIQRERVLSC
jgi:CRISPR-associated protein Cas5d